MTPPGPDPQECFAQIGRLVASPLLARSETLCKLLQYLADCTLNSPADHLKEYQIATEGLGRPADFDPQLDAGVRVHAGRLRSKLAEYYSSTGIGDSIVIDIPKGCYALSFERRAVPHEPMPLMSPMADVAAVAVGFTEPSGIRPRLVSAGTILVGVLLATGFGLYFYHYRAAQLATRRAAADLRPTAAQTFWSPFLHGPEETIVVFSNAIFVGNSETGLRYFDSSRDRRDQINQNYTGVGELAGVLELDRIFQKAGGQFRIKRGGLFTLDEARTNNLIFVGSPMENLTLRQLPTTQEFVFRRVASGENRWSEVIVNVHPQPGEISVYPPAPEAGEVEGDYAVIALLPGLDRSRSTLILAGLSTVSTQAAVDFVCSQSSLEELLHRLNVGNGTEVKPFEALLRVKAVNDVPLQTQLVNVRQNSR